MLRLALRAPGSPAAEVALMLHAVALAAGLAVIWIPLTGRFDTTSAWIGAACVLTGLLLAARFNAVDSESAAHVRALRGAARGWRRAFGAISGSGRVVSAALFGADRLKPSLARVRLRADDQAIAAFAMRASATPGLAVVETGADHVLLHTAHEDAIDVAALGAMEARAPGGGA